MYIYIYIRAEKETCVSLTTNYGDYSHGSIFFGISTHFPGWKSLKHHLWRCFFQPFPATIHCTEGELHPHPLSQFERHLHLL